MLGCSASRLERKRSLSPRLPETGCFEMGTAVVKRRGAGALHPPDAFQGLRPIDTEPEYDSCGESASLNGSAVCGFRRGMLGNANVMATEYFPKLSPTPIDLYYWRNREAALNWHSPQPIRWPH